MTTTTSAPITTDSTPEGWRLAPPGRSVGPLGHPVTVVRLVEQLTGLGVKLPDELVRFGETYKALDDVHQPKPEPVAGLAADAEQITAMVLAAAQRRAVLAELEPVIDRVHRELLTDGASWFQANVDSILDQLRPGFDKAAAAVRAAVKAGVHSTTGQLGDLPDDGITLWRQAYGRGAATHQLDMIALTRIALSESCLIAPAETAMFGADYSVCFNAPPSWWRRTGRSWEQVPDPQLLPVDESKSLRWQRRPSVYADAKAEAYHRQQHSGTDIAAALPQPISAWPTWPARADPVVGRPVNQTESNIDRPPLAYHPSHLGKQRTAR